jgi:hypothetical protein
MDNADLRNLGTINCWRDDHEGWAIRDRCHELRQNGEKHDIYEVNLGRCYNQIVCRTCGFFYKVDSSD